jgi:tau tubulin kinase
MPRRKRATVGSPFCWIQWGQGTFSQIYSAFCVDGDDKVAIKVEAPSALKPVLEWESTILKSLQKCPYVCRYYYHGYVLYA